MACGYGFFEDAVAPAGLRIVFLVVIVYGHVGVEIGLDICDFRIVDVVLIDLFGDDVETDIVFLLEHDLHLVKNELKFLSFVHRSVGLHLNLLQNHGCLHYVVIIFLAFHDQHNASGVFHLHWRIGT